MPARGRSGAGCPSVAWTAATLTRLPAARRTPAQGRRFTRAPRLSCGQESARIRHATPAAARPPGNTMSRWGATALLSNVQYQYGAQPARHTGCFLFVVSHMRSFSSLLCHILGSHPEISGYGEAQLSYFSRLDLQRLARKVQQITGNAALGRYVLDKILHNHREIAPRILDRPEIRVLFLLRNAEDTVQSILNMSRSRGHKGKFSDPVHVLDYYVKR